MKVYDGARTPFHNEIPLSWLVWSILASVSAVALLMALNSMTAKVDLGLAAFVTTALGGASTIRFLFRGALSGRDAFGEMPQNIMGSLSVSVLLVPWRLIPYPE